MTAAAPEGSTRAGARPSWRRILTHPVAHLVFAFVVIGLVQAFVVKLYFVPSSSMEPALVPGDRILVDRLAPLWSPPSTGDVIVFDADRDWDEVEPEPTIGQQLRYLVGSLTGIGPSAPHTLVKRVIAAAGQTVSCCDADGRVVVDGVGIDEPYVVADAPWSTGSLDCDSDPVSLRCFAPIEVPTGRFVVMGDNRAASSDSVSRCRGDLEPSGNGCARFATMAGLVGIAVGVSKDGG